eukprot:Nk52_evm10s230 gene=Nk52_evmTU10s230
MSVTPREVFMAGAMSSSGVGGMDFDFSAGGGGSAGFSSGAGAMSSAVMGYFSGAAGSISAFGGGSSGSHYSGENLRAMLEGSKERDKLEAMKKLIGMISLGEDVSEYFPNVVKNVVSPAIEVKKLVYIYLARYAEQKPDLALLSINTFQRDLKDPNQFIRASALRVLSNVRVPVIVPLVVLAIKTVITDRSPYVRKTAAHAIPKLYAIAPEEKETLVEFIDTLLQDNSTLVVGSVVMAFEEVCPERLDLIHRHFRKFCTLLVDVDEWGQIAILSLLTRYGRTQFLNPNLHSKGNSDSEVDQSSRKKKGFYSDSEDEDSDASSVTIGDQDMDGYVMDPDHRFLLTASKQLFQHRNSGTVMAVAMLYYYLAPSEEGHVVGKALSRIMRSGREIQYVVLRNIASMSGRRASLFAPYLKKFYVLSSDAIFNRLLKLEILTNIANEANIPALLMEFQTYVKSNDEKFAAATIQAIGRCASRIADVTENCLSGLMSLLTSRNETVVGEAVVVIKKLVQTHAKENLEIILKQLARKIDGLDSAVARANILWMFGEYAESVPEMAPDILRKSLQRFATEDPAVKLQILNLGAKLFLLNREQCELMFEYALNLARYDMTYDIRDRARFLRAMLVPEDGDGEGASSIIRDSARNIFLCDKPAPGWDSEFSAYSRFQLGTMSLLLNQEAKGYQPLPDFPTEAPDPSTRDVDDIFGRPKDDMCGGGNAGRGGAPFYGGSTESSSGSGSDSDSGEGFYSDSNESSGSGSSSESDTSSEESSSGEEESSSEDESDSDSSDESDTPLVPSVEKQRAAAQKAASKTSSQAFQAKKPTKEIRKSVTPTKKKPVNEPCLLDLGDDEEVDSSPSGSINKLSLVDSTPLAPVNAGSPKNNRHQEALHVVPVDPNHHPKPAELLNRMNAKGLSIDYSYRREQGLFPGKMIAVSLVFKNTTSSPIAHIKIGQLFLEKGVELFPFTEIDELAPDQTFETSVGIDFNDTIQPAKFELIVGETNVYKVGIRPVAGELLKPAGCSIDAFQSLKKKLSGMNESSGKAKCEAGAMNERTVRQAVLSKANVGFVGQVGEEYMFAGLTCSGGTAVLVRVEVPSADETEVSVTVHCDSMSVGSILLKDLKSSFQN